jgi:hypothetical protein
MDSDDLTQSLRIRSLIENWVIWRDKGAWDKMRTCWHSDGRMMATWFTGTAEQFIEVSRQAFDRGIIILHILGGSSIEVTQSRAVAETKVSISQRAPVDGVLCDVTCNARFYDFLEQRQGRWGIVLRRLFYDKDRIDPLEAGKTVPLDQKLLASFPEGYRHLAYIQTRVGLTVRTDLPSVRGPAVDRVYALGEEWLAGRSPDLAA